MGVWAGRVRGIHARATVWDLCDLRE
jgi:hypothetical protein